MRYTDILIPLLIINLTITLFASTNMIPNQDSYRTIQSTEEIDSNGNIVNNTQSMSYKIRYYLDNQNYINSGVQNTQQLYLFSGGDFLRALDIFMNVFVKGTVLVQPTLIALGVDPTICWYFVIPVYLLYIIAMIQMISNRQVMS